MKKTALETLLNLKGTFEGPGLNHEGQKFRGVLTLTPQIAGKSATLDFRATTEDGAVLHQEHSLIGPSANEEPSLWIMSNNHPSVLEHEYFEDDVAPGAQKTFSFRCGDFSRMDSFRETISIDLLTNGDLSYRYAWGMPGGEFKERSSARLQSGHQRAIPQAKLLQTENGLVPEGEGWYVLNARDARWRKSEKFGTTCGFEGNQRFEQYGMNIHVIQPGQPNCHYHGEDDQEDFLVIQGQCTLVIEGEERLLQPWDFVHCPKWARHVFVGAGNDPCTIVMVGGRTGHGVIYPAIELAKKYGACPDMETDSPKESYVSCPPWTAAKSAL